MTSSSTVRKHAFSVASTGAIRSSFPALERVHHGHRVAYFDGPGGTQVPAPVVEAMTDYLFHHNANTHWGFPTSAETDELLAKARQTLADFLNATPSEVGFGLNMTTLTFHLARALGRSWDARDAIIVTELDHHANIDPWRAIERERGVRIHQVRMNPESGTLDWDDLERKLGDGRVRLLAIGAASNALGTVNDIARAVAMARGAGCLTFVDAVHYAPHQLVDARAWDCDFLACSAYKFYGPHIGVIYGKRQQLEAIDFPKLEPAPDTVPERLETGTQNHEGIVGAAAAVDYMASLAHPETPHSRRECLEAVFNSLHERSEVLVHSLWDGLSQIKGIKLYGPAPDAPRTPTIAFTLAGSSAEGVSQGLAARGIFASHGNFYAMTVVKRLSIDATDGLVRLGCACYTTEDEVARVIEAVQAVARGN